MASAQESRACSDVINESCQCVHMMREAEVFVLHVACRIDPPGSGHIALPASALSVKTRTKILAFGLVAAIQKTFLEAQQYTRKDQFLLQFAGFDMEPGCLWSCPRLKLAFNPPPCLQTNSCLHWKTSGRRSPEFT